MESMGMGIDLAHSNEETFWETVRLAKKPVIDSHTGLRAVRDYPRNLTDDQIRAVADTGGVVCISFVPDQLKPGIMQEGKAEISDVVKSILHGIEITGIDHIGLGSDWDGFDGAVLGLETPAKLPALSKALLNAGLSEEETGKIMGGNMYRFLSDILHSL
jgi:membrane dipeptidase